MVDKLDKDRDGDFSYFEREATAVFPDEASLNRAVDALMQAGLTQEDMSVLAHDKHLSGSQSADQLADSDKADITAFETQDSRTEGQAAIVGTPALLAGLGAALAISTVGTALIPAFVVTAGSTIVGGGVGAILARVFGRKHADYIQQQIQDGGIVLWVRTEDEAQDNVVLGILKENGGKNAHIHKITREWGASSIPFHDVQPDPFL